MLKVTVPELGNQVFCVKFSYEKVRPTYNKQGHIRGWTSSMWGSPDGFGPILQLQPIRTLCIIESDTFEATNPSGDRFVGCVTCDTRDQFIKREGRRRALANALEHMREKVMSYTDENGNFVTIAGEDSPPFSATRKLGKVIRKRFWDAYREYIGEKPAVE